MSEQVISLSSSDDEANASKPRLKKKKIKPTIVPNVSMFVVSNSKVAKAELANKHIETVNLDSDDEVETNSSTLLNNFGKKLAVSTTTSKHPTIQQMISTILASHAAYKRNGVTISKRKWNTVSLIDSDSDKEINDKQKKSKLEKETNNEAKVQQVAVDNNKNIKLSTHSIQVLDTDVINLGSDEVLEDDAHSELIVIPDKCEKPLENKTNVDSASGKAIVIADSDDETEKENNDSVEDIQPLCESSSEGTSAHASKEEDAYIKARASLEAFLSVVEEKIKGSAFEDMLPKKVPILHKYFKKSGAYVNEMSFEALLKYNADSVTKAHNSDAANMAVVAFHKVFKHLKTHITESTIEVDEEHLPKVKKLEKVMKLLRKRIKKLEEAEVDFEDDGNSTYLILDRYQTRLKKVYAKYCEYIKRNPFSGRPIYDRISFVHSKYNEINQALTKKYRNSVHFPTYYEFEKYIKKTVKKRNLDMSEQEIKTESRKCFKHLGGILQKKRRQELYDSHLDFIEYKEDPASKDILLENQLQKNYSEGKEKIDKFFQKYTDKQEQGEDHISSNEEESSASSTESDDIEEVTNKEVSPKKTAKKVSENGIEEKNCANNEKHQISDDKEKCVEGGNGDKIAINIKDNVESSSVEEIATQGENIEIQTINKASKSEMNESCVDEVGKVDNKQVEKEEESREALVKEPEVGKEELGVKSSHAGESERDKPIENDVVRKNSATSSSEPEISGSCLTKDCVS